ncbi:MAG: hypothetical protein ACRDZY_14435, partial [Acidimicrobiales bacterium]
MAVRHVRAVAGSARRSSTAELAEAVLAERSRRRPEFPGRAEVLGRGRSRPRLPSRRLLEPTGAPLPLHPANA